MGASMEIGAGMTGTPALLSDLPAATWFLDSCDGCMAKVPGWGLLCCGRDGGAGGGAPCAWIILPCSLSLEITQAW